MIWAIWVFFGELSYLSLLGKWGDLCYSGEIRNLDDLGDMGYLGALGELDDLVYLGYLGNLGGVQMTWAI